jgi:hypothetical protein
LYGGLIKGLYINPLTGPVRIILEALAQSSFGVGMALGYYDFEYLPELSQILQI